MARAALEQAAELIYGARCPVLVACGGEEAMTQGPSGCRPSTKALDGGRTRLIEVRCEPDD